MFTLAEWLKEGHGLAERVDSRPKSNWGVFQDSCLGPHYAGNWNPRNDANESGGNYSALESTIGSINTGFIGMAKQLDLCGIKQTAEAFGVHRADGDPLVQGPSSVIGTNEVAPLSMAVAFAGIANNGLTYTPIAIDRIVGRDGEEIPPPVSTCAQAVSPEVAAAMHYAMVRVMTSGTAVSSNGATSPRVPMIGPDIDSIETPREAASASTSSESGFGSTMRIRPQRSSTVVVSREWPFTVSSLPTSSQRKRTISSGRARTK